MDPKVAEEELLYVTAKTLGLLPSDEDNETASNEPLNDELSLVDG